MYTPHVVTVYNVTEDPTTLALNYNVTILDGVFLDIGKTSTISKLGVENADAVQLFVPFSVSAKDGTTGATKTYLSPKQYRASTDKSSHWTLEPGGKSSGVDCFFVKGNVVSQDGYKYLRENYDYVFDVTTVDLRDFGSADMQHWQVGGK